MNVTFITQELDYVSRGGTAGDRKQISRRKILKRFGNSSFLLLVEISENLYGRIGGGRTLTVENYPDLAYPIYIYYLVFFMICARQHTTKHLDKSYVRDFRYLHYLNFCDLFINKRKIYTTHSQFDTIPRYKGNPRHHRPRTERKTHLS